MELEGCWELQSNLPPSPSKTQERCGTMGRAVNSPLSPFLLFPQVVRGQPLQNYEPAGGNQPVLSLRAGGLNAINMTQSWPILRSSNNLGYP
uniref:Uncharacterized protein n=1 Tax=Gopherus evgoodei TaxID=1825980 RepID=A0A8C5EZR0_9SAUR